jgi:uncharacterized membrane protein YoaK (UPF0700 family)
MSGWPPPTDPERASAALRASPRRPLLRPSLFALTFATGVVDAVSYLGIGGVFTANQTGNLVLIGFAVGGTQGFSVVRTVLSLVGFAAGAVLAGAIARHWHPRPFIWMQRVTWTLIAAFVVVLLLLTQLPEAGDERDPARLVAVGLLAIAMGLLNATVRRLGFRDIPTTVATSTISDLASESRWGGGERGNQRDRALALALMLGGAVAGAVIVHAASSAAAFAVALGAALAASVHQAAVARRIPGAPSGGVREPAESPEP